MLSGHYIMILVTMKKDYFVQLIKPKIAILTTKKWLPSFKYSQKTRML